MTGNPFKMGLVFKLTIGYLTVNKPRLHKIQNSRSLVETKMRCFKLLGEHVKARLFNSQVAELKNSGGAVKSVYPFRVADHCYYTLNPYSDLGKRSFAL